MQVAREIILDRDIREPQQIDMIPEGMEIFQERVEQAAHAQDLLVGVHPPTSDSGGTLSPPSRADRTLTPEAPHLVFVYAAIQGRPKDVQRLVAHDVDVIAGL